MNPTCKTCRFYKEDASICRRYPRTVFYRKMWDEGEECNAVSFYYPKTAEDDWCGEYKPQEESKP